MPKLEAVQHQLKFSVLTLVLLWAGLFYCMVKEWSLLALGVKSVG